MIRSRRVYFFQAADDFLGVRLDTNRCDERGMAGGGRARQLIGDDLIHAPDLLEYGPAEFFALGAGFELAAHNGQRCLQAVGEVGQRVAIAREMVTLALDEIVEVGGQARQFERIAVGQAVLIAAFDTREVAGDAAQRTQAPAQRGQQQRQQQHAEAAEVDQQRAPEHVELGAQVGRVLGDVQGQVDRATVGRVPFAHAHAEDVYLARRTVAQVELPGAGLEDDGERQVDAERGWRAPVVLLAAVDLDRRDDAGIKAAAGPVETRVRRHLRRQPAARARNFGTGDITVGVTLQAVVQRRTQGLVDGRVEREAGEAEERRQRNTGGEQGTGLQR